MRPIQLEMRAFGPYAEVQKLDFRELGHRSLLLVHGPTGAGKTTIFDAICFALYGDGSCERRDGKAMRSHLSNEQTATEVIFDFALGPEQYRVQRRPEQQRPKKRGAGFVTEASQATLWRRTGVSEDRDDGVVLAAQWGKVTAEIEGLFGFKSSQFRQVVMLPQGEFQRMLLADSNEREDILEALFQTARFRRIEEILKEGAKAQEVQLQELRQRQDFVLGQACVANIVELRDELRKRENDYTDGVLSLERLGRLRDETEAKQKLGYVVLNKLREDEQARLALDALTLREPEFEAQQRALLRGQAAAALAGAEQALTSRRKEAIERRREREEAQEILREATARKSATEKALAVEQAREMERFQSAEDRRRLEEIAEKANHLQDSEKEAAAAKALLERLTTERMKAHTTLAEIRQTLLQQREGRGALEAAAAPREALRQQAQARVAELEQRKKLESARAARKAAEEAAQVGTVAREHAERELTAARAEVEAIEALWLESQAAVLAQHLHPGEACPVCGSEEHPHPATAAQELPTQDALKKRRAEAQKREKDLQTAARAEGDGREKAARAQAEAAAIEQSLGGLAELPVPALQQACDAARGALAAAEKAASSLAETDQQIATLAEREAKGVAYLEDRDRQHRDAELQHGRTYAVWQERLRAIPEALRARGALEVALSGAKAREAKLKEAWEKAQAAAHQAAERLAGSTAREESARENADAAARQAGADEAAFGAAVLAAGFNDNQDYQQAKRPAAQLAALQRDIVQFRDDLIGTRDRAKRAKEAAEGQVAPDMAHIEELMRRIQEEYDRVHQRMGALQSEQQQLQGWSNQLEELNTRAAAVDAQYAVAGRLAAVAGGKNRLGITLQRFVQATLLDDVLSAASLRLERMSGGRYLLQRALDRTDKRSAGGLDLEVYDNYTDRSRPASTLSGGETFLASLSLALGLADTVQRYAGGIFLEAIFVDEGFGTLDPETLDLALECLIQLQQGGRLVGLISHVPELKERIEARLEVTPRARGSVARFVVG